MGKKRDSVVPGVIRKKKKYDLGACVRENNRVLYTGSLFAPSDGATYYILKDLYDKICSLKWLLHYIIPYCLNGCFLRCEGR